MNADRVSDTWERGSPYESYIGRWSRGIAPLFLAWLDQPAGRRWLDIGCGTGALCAAILDRAAPSSLIGAEPSPGFRELASRNLGERARLLAASAEEMALTSGSCDVVVSGLVLNFLPDLRAALTEMRRVCTPGGTLAAYVWDYADGMEIIRRFWESAVSLDPAASGFDEGTRFALCRPAALKTAFERAGLVEVETTSLELDAAFAGFDDYWQPFLGGQGPAPAYAMSLTEEQRSRLRAKLKADLAPADGGGITLRARAWAVRGINLTGVSRDSPSA